LVQNLTAIENIELATQICKDPLDVEKTLEAVGLMDTFRDIKPTYSLDVLTNLQTEEVVLKIHGIFLENIKNKDENYTRLLRKLMGS